MMSASKFNLLESISNPLTFESSEVLPGHSLDNIGCPDFPLVPTSKDYSLKNHYGTEETTEFLKILEASCDSNDEYLNFPQYISEEIVNKLDTSQGASPLHYASMNGKFSIVRFLLENGAQVDIWDANNNVTPLICAAAYGQQEIVELLLQNGSDIDAGLKENSASALLWAVRRNHPDVVQILLNHGASQNSGIMYSETTIHAAVMCGNAEILEMLIFSEGFITADFYMGPGKYTPLHLSASGSFPNSFNICKLLLEKARVFVNPMTSNGKTPLALAAGMSKDADLIRLLLSHGANPNIPDDDGRTPLFYVIEEERNSLECLMALCQEEQVNLNHQDKQGYSALHFSGFKESGASAEVLLMNGADFSLKTNNGFTALSILRRRIPAIETILRNVFDQAVKTSVGHQPPSNDITHSLTQNRQNFKVKVNYNCIVTSSPYVSKNKPPPSYHEMNKNGDTMTSPCGSNKSTAIIRKETAKVKCLVDENLDSLLLHPVVHSFLVLKWKKARHIFLANFIFKMILVILFSAYVHAPYILGEKPKDNRDITAQSLNMNFSETDGNSSISNDTSFSEAGFKGKIPIAFVALYVLIVTMVTVNGIIMFAEILRAPKPQLRTLEPWIFLTVIVIIFYMNPKSWGKTGDLFYRSMAALGMCLAWIDIWIYMGRFPTFGLSIRIFVKVLHNFTIFIIPHVCLLAGFVLSFTLLFPNNAEYSSILMTLTKAVRIMAGDEGLPEEEQKILSPGQELKAVLSHYFVVYMYTTFVLLVGIVLMNMLIGLAVNDIQGIYAEASKNRLKKQTILLNTLDTNFNGKWVRSWMPKSFLAKYVNLFSVNCHNKILTFKPYDSRDSKLTTELKLALAKINSPAWRNRPNTIFQTTEDNSSNNIQRWTDAVNKLLTISNKEDEQQILLKKVNGLLDKVTLLLDSMNIQVDRK